MFTYDAVLAAALLTSPSGPPSATNAAWSDRLGPFVIALAIEAEVLDPREGDRIFQKPHHFRHDLNLLRDRWQDLSNAPFVEEGRRFPACSPAKECLALNRAVREELLQRIAQDASRAEEWRNALEENERLHQIWEEVRYANGCYDITVRRRALMRLRELLGAEAFYRGHLPPPVPLALIPR